MWHSPARPLRRTSPVSLQRLHYDARKRRVWVVSDKTEGLTSGIHELDPLDFLARLLTHVPDKIHIYVRL